MPEIYLRQPRFTYSEPFTKNKTNYKYLKKQDNQYIFIKMSYTRPYFIMIWLMENLKVCLEEQLLIKCYEVKHLILLIIEKMMDISMDLFQWFTSF